jgi:hypothetical protein
LQLFFWIDEKPEVAFDQAAAAFGIAETTWDTTGVVFNALVDILNSGIVPIWNAAVYHIVEPTLTLLVEVFSIVFLLRPWPGLVGDEFYFGFDCTATDEAFAWCGRFGHYADALQSPEIAPRFADESQSYGSRALAEVLEMNDTYTFGLATARRLAELADGETATPSFSTSALTDALDMLTNFVLGIVPPILDMFFSIFQEIIITSFTVLVDVVKTVVTQIFEVVKMLIKSGMLTTIINVGMDFLIIMVTEILLPLLFAAIDTLMCILDLFAPSGWNEQLECAIKNQTCHARHLSLPQKSHPVQFGNAICAPRFRALQVRGEHVLQGAQHRCRPDGLHRRADRHPPVHGDHGRDAQLAQRPKVRKGLLGRVLDQGQDEGREDGKDDQQRRARERAGRLARQGVHVRRRL